MLKPGNSRNFRIKLEMLMIMLPFIAVNIPSTLKPGTNHEVIKSKKPFIKNVKIPKLRRLMGSVINMRNGLISRFTIPRIKAAAVAEKAPLTFMPSRKSAANNMAAALIKSLSSKKRNAMF